MKLSIVVLAAALGVACPALAQSAPPPDQGPAVIPAPEDAGPGPGAPPPMGGPGQAAGNAKAIRQACRDEVRGQALRGPERMQAISACVVKQRPDLAQREQCRMDGFGKGLRKDDLRAFVRDCIKGRG